MSVIKMQNKHKETTTELMIHRCASSKICQVWKYFYFLTHPKTLYIKILYVIKFAIFVINFQNISFGCSLNETFIYIYIQKYTVDIQLNDIFIHYCSVIIHQILSEQKLLIISLTKPWKSKLCVSYNYNNKFILLYCQNLGALWCRNS